MNRVLNAMSEHGVHGEWVDENILIYVDDQFRGQFPPKDHRQFEFCPTTLAKIDYNTLTRINGALGKANKARFRETA